MLRNHVWFLWEAPGGDSSMIIQVEENIAIEVKLRAMKHT
jgi:hypothetical protein